MTPVEYKPYRILQRLTTSGHDEKTMKRRFPNATRYEKSQGVRRSWSAIYEPGIINVPSGHEVKIFNAFPNSIVTAIPQDPRGFDKRDSGVARSVKTSEKARSDSALEIARQRMAEKKESMKEPEKQTSSTPPPKVAAVTDDSTVADVTDEKPESPAEPGETEKIEIPDSSQAKSPGSRPTSGKKRSRKTASKKKYPSDTPRKTDATDEGATES